MSDYWDFIQSRMTSHNPLDWIYDVYKDAYEGSHGGLRYTLSQIPFLSHLKRFEDEYKRWEDSYSNTGKDPAYISRYDSSNSGNLFNGESSRLVRMSMSLADMYTPEVVENLDQKYNNSYR